jgi:AraC family transcriptional regulator of adaptative response/methylated-DNA-[protein]-cysteine methyltransferase
MEQLMNTPTSVPAMRAAQTAEASTETPTKVEPDADDTALAVEQLRWSAVITRDGQCDGEFVYAVRTTGIYCRASCPSRTARRENVEFFDTTDLARAAGYRACKRCTPDEVSLEHRRNDAVTAACRAIEASAAPLRLNDLARDAGLSPHHFHRVFRQVTGVTPGAYVRAIRHKRMQAALASAPSVTDAIHDAGFNSSSRFYAGGTEALGMAPTAWRTGGAGERIRYAVEPCALGVIIVAATPRGVCCIEFGDSAHALVERLRARFPKAALEPGDPQFLQWVGAVLAFIEQPRGVLDLPLDIQGTAFQRQVWEALRTIPAGRRVSYTDVASAIGRPEAVRAVATACASNAVAVAIPCHRVVRNDGGLAGYRWGIERKAELLRREAVATTGAQDSTPVGDDAAPVRPALRG